MSEKCKRKTETSRQKAAIEPTWMNRVTTVRSSPPANYKLQKMPQMTNLVHSGRKFPWAWDASAKLLPLLDISAINKPARLIIIAYWIPFAKIRTSTKKEKQDLADSMMIHFWEKAQSRIVWRQRWIKLNFCAHALNEQTMSTQLNGESAPPFLFKY